MSDDYECPKHPDSRRDLEQRKADRLAGKLNPPVRGTHGLANIVAKAAGRKPHPLTCQCATCLPDWLREEMKSWPVVTPGMYEASPRPAKPVTVLPSKEVGRPRRRSKWSGQRGNSGN